MAEMIQVADEPCEDCIGHICTMNCSGSRLVEKPDQDRFIFDWFNNRDPHEMAKCLVAFKTTAKDTGNAG